ncbi:LOW QUALITY PROTEIN: hypothetical protein PHMEG_00041355, partial [Phytophthora megakarya]
MGFMVPAGVRMDLGDGSMRSPDGTVWREGEISIPRKKATNPGWTVGKDSREDKILATEKLWVTRGERWVPTVTEDPGQIHYLVISNIGEEILRLDHRLDVGMILDQDKVPRSPGFVSVGSHRYTEIQRPTYPTPRSVLRRARTADIDRDQTLISTLELRSRVGTANATQIEATFLNPGPGHPSTSPINPDADRYRSSDAGGGGITCQIIRHSTSPCASPIESNGVDIRLCIDYKLWLLSRAHDGLGSRDDARRVNA